MSSISIVFSSGWHYNPSLYVREHFTYCYDGKSTGLDSLINLKGYYEITDISFNSYGFGKYYHSGIDTSYRGIIFFKDGVCLWQFGGGVKNKKYLDSITADKTHPEIRGWLSGRYKMFGDTIKMQVIEDNRWSNDSRWIAYELWYKIENKKIIRFIGLKSFSGAFNNEFTLANPNSQYMDKAHTAHFVSIDTLPSSQIWLMKRKWFWCSEEKYEAWKKELKK